jgi:hypothetical protein
MRPTWCSQVSEESRSFAAWLSCLRVGHATDAWRADPQFLLSEMQAIDYAGEECWPELAESGSIDGLALITLRDEIQRQSFRS